MIAEAVDQERLVLNTCGIRPLGILCNSTDANAIQQVRKQHGSIIRAENSHRHRERFDVRSQARTGGHAAFVQTAAASTLGIMIFRLAKRFQLTGIHVVRRLERVRKLKNLGCEHVFDSSDASFQKRLAETCNELKASIAFDAVGGELTAA